MTDATPTTTQMITTIGATVAKNLLMIVGASAASHGLISGSGVETFVSLGMVLIGAAWSFWNSYGRAIVLAKLDVWKATAQAQADALRKANVPGPTAAQIADKIPDPAVTAQTVTKVMTAGCLLLAALLIASPALAQKKFPNLLQGGSVPASTAREDSQNAVTSAAGALTVDPMKSSDPKGDFITQIITHINKRGTQAMNDIDQANALASANDPDTGKPKDEIAAACYPQAKKFLQTLQGTLTADQQPAGTAAPDVGPGLITLFERKRLLVIFIKKGMPNYLVIGCSPLLGDEAKVLAGVLGMVGINFLIPGGGLPAIAGALAPLKIL